VIARYVAGRGARSVGWSCQSDGFTLIEVMAALAILGAALLVLLDNHYSAMRLHDATRETVTMSSLLHQATGLAEVEVQSGKSEGSGDFGPRHSGYAYSYAAAPVQKEQGVALYSVTVTVKAPDDERSLTILVYQMGAIPGASSPSPAKPARS